MYRLLIAVKPSTFKGNWMVNYANVSLVNLKLVRLPHFTGLENLVFIERLHIRTIAIDSEGESLNHL